MNLSKHLELVPEDEILKPDSQINFLPHHCVHKDSTTTKLRVVFDGSAKLSNGISLNGSLMVGPTVQEDLISILIRFRTHKVALLGDIAKMYRQLALSHCAKDFHRILWRDSPEEPIKHYRMTRVTYGIASSAFHSTRSLVEVANRCKDESLQKSIKQDFYVDDYLSGADSIPEAHNKVEQIGQQLKKHGFDLRKWSSSHHEIISSLPEALRENGDQEKFMDENYKIKTLGISWMPNTDIFCFHTKFNQETKLTKRDLLSETAKLFDPIGWFGPIIIQFKRLLQKLWIRGIEWEMKTDLATLHTFTLKRCILPPAKVEEIQLHLFTDASESAYAAVIYARIVDAEGFVSVNIIAGKNRVTPIKTVSLPRLELCGAHLGAKLLTKVKEIMMLTSLPKQQIFGWTDSTIVLQWYCKPNYHEHGQHLSLIVSQRYNKICQGQIGIMSPHPVTQQIVHLEAQHSKY